MHAFSADASAVFLLDSFGLSRIGLDGRQAKTNSTALGGALVCAGARLTLGKLGSAPAVVIDAKTLARAKGVPERRGDVVAHPDGKRLLELRDGQLEIGKARFTLRPKKLRAQRLGRPLPLPVSWVLGGLTAVDHGGVVAHFDLERGVLTRFALAGAKPTDVVSVAVPAPIGALSLVVAQGRVMLATHEPSTGRAHALFLDEHADVRVASFDTGARLSFDGRAVAYQMDPKTVVVEVGRERERFSIPSAAQGIGEPMVQGAHVLFVAPSRESVADLRTGAVLDRRLSATERKEGRPMVAFTARANELGRPFDVTFGVARKAFRGVSERSMELECSLGDQSLFSLLVRGAVTRRFVDELRARSMSLPVAVTTTSEAALKAGLAKLRSLGVSLIDGVAVCEGPFGAAIGRVGTPPTARGRLFEGKAGTRFLEAVVGGAVTAAKLVELERDAAPRLAGSARSALAWALIEIMGERAWPTLFAWLVTHPDEDTASNVGNSSDALVRLCELHPSVRSSVLDACDRAMSGDEDQQQRVADVRRALGAYDREQWRQDFTRLLPFALKVLLAKIKRPLAVALNCTPSQKGDVVSISVATAADDPRDVEAWEIASWKHYEASRERNAPWPRAARLAAMAHEEYARLAARKTRAHLQFRDRFCADCADALRKASLPKQCRTYVGHPDEPERNFATKAG